MRRLGCVRVWTRHGRHVAWLSQVHLILVYLILGVSQSSYPPFCNALSELVRIIVLSPSVSLSLTHLTVLSLLFLPSLLLPTLPSIFSPLRVYLQVVLLLASVLVYPTDHSYPKQFELLTTKQFIKAFLQQ